MIALFAYGVLRQGPVPGVVIEPGGEAADMGREPEMREETDGRHARRGR